MADGTRRCGIAMRNPFGARDLDQEARAVLGFA
jgi:hypothetical protein